MTRPRRRQRGQVLIVIFLGTLLVGGAMAHGGHRLFGGKGGEALGKQVKAAIADPARQAGALRVTQKIVTAEKRLQADRKALEKDAFAALERHDTPRATFDALIARADGISDASRRELLDLRFGLRAQLTATEWESLFGKPLAK